MKKIRIAFLYLAIISMVYILVLSVFGQAETTKKLVTYEYSAKRVISGNKTGVTILKGDAKFTKTDPEANAKDYHVYADQITIYKDIETKKTTRMEALGNVKMKDGDMLVNCARAVMKYEPDEVIEMEGSPAVVDDGENKIEAPLIKYFRKEDRLEAEATEGVVTGHITVEENTTQEEKKAETGK
jgi:lipopolysaccharide export system protein LptA